MNILPFTPKAVSLANTLIQQNVYKYNVFTQKKIILAVLKELTEIDVGQLFKAVSVVNPNYYKSTNFDFNIEDLCYIVACIECIKDAMSLQNNLSVTEDFEIEVEMMVHDSFRLLSESRVRVQGVTKNSSDNSNIKAKSIEEMNALAEDGCGGACTI